ncbi:uncharacterized protein Bfra_001329 [Botrytis fragariae]|uniref:RRM domain-containing protein n=1 Tax=Botrytis fragariae TaxID=1964551 RepID=A0A8H6B048_9HELO|nr:uncharacterized protein Bfra_001329 [Botrytis fragariae]KAF5876971.1 hypothetical protein Bfra_001329 [Botrytis fragariae]
MSRPPPYYVPIHLMENFRAPQVPQPTESNAERWNVRNLPDMPAWISTDRGRFPKRESAAMGIPCIVHCDVVADAKAKAASLFEIYPDIVSYVSKPTNWDDLYFLWDAADIQLESPGFLYYVMFFIGEENERRKPEIQKEINDEINEHAEAWVTDHRDLVLNSAAGSMYQHFCQDEPEEVAPELKSTLEAALENCRLRLIQATTVTNSVSSHEPYHLLNPQVTGASSVRAVSGNGTRHVHAGKQVNRPAIAPMTGKAGGINLGSHCFSSMQPQSKSSFHTNSTASMPLNPTAQNKLKSANRGEAAAGMTSTYPHQQPQNYDRSIKDQRSMGNKINATTSLNASPTRSESHQKQSGLRNKSRHRGNSIETHQNRRHNWTGPHGTQPHKLMHPSQNNQQHNMFNGTRGSPSRVLQPEPIYFHKEHAPLPFTDNFNRRMDKDNSVNSRMELPNDVRNLKKLENFKISQSLANLGEMEGDPKLYKTDDFCLYTYDNSAPRCTSGRTLYMTGADLKMFYTHELKNLMSQVGKVVSIKFLLRPNNNGPIFITFDADVLAMAIEKFDGYKMSNGRVLTAGYPLENSRERSGSNSSYHSYHGDNQNRYMFNPAAENRAWSRKNSISQHRPSKSQSGQNQFRYQNGNHMAPGNASDPFPYTPDSQSIPPYPLTQAPLQQIPGHGLSAAFTEVIQHERGVGAYFQQQMPRAVLNNRTNTAGTAPYRSYNGAQADRHRNGTRPGIDHNMANLPNRPVDKKENSPIKKTFSQSRPSGKDSTDSSGSRHKKTVDQDMPSNTIPIVTPVRSTSHIQLDDQYALASPKASPIEELTSSTTGQSLTTGAKVETMADMKMENDEQIPVEIFESTGPVESSLPEPLGETVAAIDSESMSQGKAKNSKKNKKQFKSNNKAEIDKENNISVIPAMLSPTESTITNPSLGGEDTLFSGDSTRKPSISSTESLSNDASKDSILQQATRDGTDISVDSERTTGKSLDKEVRSETISTPRVTTASITPNVPLAKSNHKKSKAHGSTKDFKKQTQSNCPGNNNVSSTTNTVSVRKTEPKTVKHQGKISKDCGSEFLGQQEQSKTDLKNKKKRSFPEVNQEKIKPSVSVDPTNSSEWPALAPSKSSPSSIADGKPPQLPALPALNNRRTKEVILPALPLKPHRQSGYTLGSKAWPFVRKCKRKVSPEGGDG